MRGRPFTRSRRSGLRRRHSPRLTPSASHPIVGCRVRSGSALGLADQMAEIALLFPSDSKFDTPLPQFAAPVSDKPIILPRVSSMGAASRGLEGGTFRLGKLTAIPPCLKSAFWWRLFEATFRLPRCFGRGVPWRAIRATSVNFLRVAELKYRSLDRMRRASGESLRVDGGRQCAHLHSWLLA